MAKREELISKIEIQGDLEGALVKKRAYADQLAARLTKHATRLTKKRANTAKVLSEKVAELLQVLGFKKARLAIEVIQDSDIHERGNSHCRFLFAPNSGQDLMPLKKIASSGETARVMLALKTILAEADATPLLVFDEVDANVGGEVGRAVAAELARLAGKHQVFCVTHLPQVASMAESHFLVAKSQDDQSTSVMIEPIHCDRETRLGELSRMLGDRNSASARAHAEELLA